MNGNVNIVMLRGNWAKDPDLRYTENGRPFALCTLAVDRPAGQNGEEKVADFIPVIVGGDLAEAVAEQTAKGSAVWVIGALRVRSYQDANGNKRTTMNVNAFQVGPIFNGKKKAKQNGTNRASSGARNSAISGYQSGSWAAGSASFSNLPEDLLSDEGDFNNEDDLPF